MTPKDKYYFKSGCIYDTSFINSKDLIGCFTIINDDVIELTYTSNYGFGGFILSVQELNPQQTIFKIIETVAYDVHLNTSCVEVKPSYINA